MSFWKKTVREYDLGGKRVILHAELDAPLTSDGKEVTSDYRIRSSIPTIKYLQEQGCKVILISKLGRPDGKVDPTQSLLPVAKCLSDLMGQHIQFVPDCVGEAVSTVVDAMQPGDVVMLENLRFHPEEEANDEGFARNIVESARGEVFVYDCFALAHRKEAGTDAITRVLPSIAGLHLEKEVDTITNVMENPAHPLMAIIGGAKISDKIEILNRFIDIADVVAVGGAMANTFLLAEGIDIGKSKAEPDSIAIAKDIIDKARQKAKNQRFIFYLPQDGVVAESLDKTAKTRIVDWDAHIIASVESYPKRPSRGSATVAPEELILDIGPFSGSFIAGCMQLVDTVIWNGAMGVTETVGLQGPVGPFSHGTELIMDAMLGQYGHKPFSLVGGGDTSGYIEERKMVDAFNHVSTGGGASLELMSGKSLPGVEALLNKDQ
jgi:3-phosphoglycerate kinase